MQDNNDHPTAKHIAQVHMLDDKFIKITKKLINHEKSNISDPNIQAKSFKDSGNLAAVV